MPLAQNQATCEVSWIQRFDGEGVNWNNWTAQIQANYNNEIQRYTDHETSTQGNFEVSDGTHKITARRQNISCPGWINSQDKAEFLYGRIETRLRFLELRGGTWVIVVVQAPQEPETASGWGGGAASMLTS